MIENYRLELRGEFTPTRETLDAIAEINESSAYYNLTLSEKDISELIAERGAALGGAERLEFGFETLLSIIVEFYKSPYVNQFEYTEIINEIQYLFYALKNEIDESMTDEELIKLMAELFDGPCNGSLELLKGTGAEYIITQAKSKKGWKYEKKSAKNAPSASLYPITGGELAAVYTNEQRIMLAESLAVILKELSLRYTKGRSASIKTEIAQSIIKSIVYAAGLSGYAEIYRLDKLREAYGKGLYILEGIVTEARALYGKVAAKRLDLPLGGYNRALDTEIPAFFECYDILYAAVGVPELSYYPVLEDARLSGASYMRDYLEKLLLENEACSAYEIADLERVLVTYDENEGSLAADCANIFELAVINGFFAALIGKPPSDIVLTEAHRSIIKRRLKDIAENGEKIYTVIKEIDFFPSFYDERVRGYAEKYIAERLLQRIDNADGDAVRLGVFEK